MSTECQSSTMDRERWPTFRDFIRISIPLILLLAAVFTAIHIFHYAFTRNILDVREHSYIRIGHEAIRNDIRAATSDLLYLAESKHLQDLLISGSPEIKAHLAKEFASILSTKKIYDQLRYLDETGMEVTRVNYNSGVPLVVPDEKLQNKSRRYYFEDTIKLNRWIVFVSPMDLNIEKGQIERPLKPMLRFGTPVFDERGRKRGVLIINYFADKIRRNIKQFLKNPDSDTMLLNAQGYWLIAPDPIDEWGFMFHHKRRFADRYPEVWRKMTQLKNGQIESKQGLFTYTTIHPLRAEHATSSSRTYNTQAKNLPSVDEKAYFWILASHIPNARLAAEKIHHIKQGTIQFGLVSLIMFPLAWQFSRERVKRKSASRALKESENYMLSVTSQLAEGLMVIDRKGYLMSTNQEAERLLGWHKEELIGTELDTIISHFGKQESNVNHGSVVISAIEDGISQYIDHIPITTKQGTPIQISLSVAPLRYDGAIRGAIITFRDISERLKMQAELKMLATHDPLTGAKNRGEIERLLAEELERALRHHRSLVILMLDIDHFKKINDTYGHQKGDAVLRMGSANMSKSLRTNDLLGRYGGEEFLVILPETNVDAGLAVAERLRNNLANTSIPVNQQQNIHVTVSIGMASYPYSANDSEHLIQTADAMLYKAKKRGRNCIVPDHATY